ncbi:LysR family transcriptional regulator [Streptomyces sp. NPDC087843]|uniref:LysR family transcriptional regulator n=1 Tax=Streptomyces sp. NPDC087843 TaxID=3365804 RepID=UPI003825ECAB
MRESFARSRGPSESLNVTQSGLSHQLQAREREVGDLLLERPPRGVRLTPAGRSMQPHACVRLADLAERDWVHFTPRRRALRNPPGLLMPAYVAERERLRETDRITRAAPHKQRVQLLPRMRLRVIIRFCDFRRVPERTPSVFACPSPSAGTRIFPVAIPVHRP